MAGVARTALDSKNANKLLAVIGDEVNPVILLMYLI